MPGRGRVQYGSNFEAVYIRGRSVRAKQTIIEEAIFNRRKGAGIGSSA